MSAVPIGIGIYLVTRGEKAPKEHWFERHLNVTLVLSWIIALLFWLTFGSDWWFNLGDTTIHWSPAIKTEVYGGWVEAISWVGTPAIILLVTIWYLIKNDPPPQN